jgi:phytoene synthase
METRERALKVFGDRFFADLAAGKSSDPVLRAVVDTVLTCKIDPECFRRFLRSMTMDLTVEKYETWADLLVYMDGSAAVIGEMMLPILEPTNAAAIGPARDLGNAFQLTNFLRDVNEDLDRGRVYIPQEDVKRFGVDLSERRCSPQFVELMKFEIARCLSPRDRSVRLESSTGGSSTRSKCSTTTCLPNVRRCRRGKRRSW